MRRVAASDGDRGGALLVVGGYGLVGAQASSLLRRRHPGLPLVLAGRRPAAARELAASLGARTAALDARAERPLAALDERPAAILAAVGDPDDRLLGDALREGIPFADVNRGGHASVLDAVVRVAHQRPRAPVLLAGGWMAGLAALAAAAAVRELGRAERVDVVALVSSGDRIGRSASGFGRRLAWPYHVMRDGRRRPVQPLSGARRARCPDGRARMAALVGTLEQISLPTTLGVPTVETRIALHDEPALWALIALKRSGALKALERPSLGRLRAALLERSGTGDLAGFSVTASGGGRSARVDVLDVRGQGHLSAVGAVAAAERVLGFGRAALPAGVSFPEQSADPQRDLALLKQAGAVVRLELPHHARRTRPAIAPGRRALASPTDGRSIR
jgi:hypothetical protein